MKSRNPQRVGKPLLSERQRMLLQGFVISALVLLIYWPTFHAPFDGDDALYLSDNPLLSDPARLWKAWFVPGSFIEYYPIEQTVQWVQWQLWHENTLGYHLTNAVLHIVNALLVWHVLTKFRLRSAWLGGLIFAVHPLQVESVASIAELKNTLSLAPFLLAISFWINFENDRRPRDYWLAFLFFTAAMLCKASMLPFPFVLLLYAWWKRGRIVVKDLLHSLPFFIVSVGLGLLIVFCGQWYAHDNPTSLPPHEVAIPFLSRVALVGTSYLFYLAHFVWPLRPLPGYPLWTIDPVAAWHVLPWLVLLAGGICAWLKRGTWGRHALLGIGFCLLFLAPVAGVVPISFMLYSWVMDHFIYLPMIGLIGLVVAAFDDLRGKLGSSQIFAVAGMSLWLALIGWSSLRYAEICSVPEKIYAYTLRYNPDSWSTRQEWGEYLLQQGNAQDALAQLEQALPHAPEKSIVLHDMGNALAQLGRNEAAADAYEQGLKAYPNSPQLEDDYGALLAAMKRSTEAVAHFQRALQLKPDLGQAHNDWANALLNERHTDEAIEHFQLALKSNPNVPQIHLNLGAALIQANRKDEAIAQFQEVLRLEPDNADAQKALQALGAH